MPIAVNPSSTTPLTMPTLPTAFPVYQRTVNAAVTIQGIGLHSGTQASITLQPAPENHGIEFVITHSDNRVYSLRPSPDKIVDASMCSNLADAHMRIATVEHLMSAFAALAIDNVIIQLAGEEIPILDGSSAPFIQAVMDVGIRELPCKRQYIRILAPIVVELDDKKAAVLPVPASETDFVLSFTIDFTHPAIANSNSHFQFCLSSQQYAVDIARARTFGFMKDVAYLHSKGLALGGSLDNAVVLDDTCVINPEGLRYADEFVRHKILDALGDLFIIGRPIIGHYQAYKSGHHVNNLLLKALQQHPNCWSFVTL